MKRYWSRLRRRAASSEGVTTMEYSMVLGFMSALCIYFTTRLIAVLENLVANFAIRVAVYMTGFPD